MLTTKKSMNQNTLVIPEAGLLEGRAREAITFENAA